MVESRSGGSGPRRPGWDLVVFLAILGVGLTLILVTGAGPATLAAYAGMVSTLFAVWRHR